jgi:hypothetical protein
MATTVSGSTPQQITLIPAILVLSTILYLSTAAAQITETKLLASDGHSFDLFGYSVSLSGDHAVIGAYTEDPANGTDAGSAYLFQFDGSHWVMQTKFNPEDASAFDYFGYSVSLFGNWCLVGAVGDDDNGKRDAGAVYFHRGGSTLEQTKYRASDAAAGDFFGNSVSLSGDYALIGAFRDDDNGEDAGAAYMFHFNGTEWVEHTKLLASNPAGSTGFGWSVSLSGDYALIGVPNDGNAGSSYIFHFDGSNWVEQARLTASDGTAGDQFGYSVALSGDLALIGAYNDDENGTSSGSAYIFRSNGSTWVEEAKLLASDSQPFDLFGYSVSLSGDYALVGAPVDQNNRTDTGSSYIFHFNGLSWDEETKLLASDGAIVDYFGCSVSLSGDIALVGAMFDDDDETGEDAGASYVFSGFGGAPSQIPCEAFGFFNAKCNANGTAQAMVRLPNSTHYAGEMIEFQFDDTVYPVELITNGTHTIGRLQVSGAGAGAHTITLVDPPACYPPVHFNCQTEGTGYDPEFYALWKEFDDFQSVVSPNVTIPADPLLHQNYPNPFNPQTEIRFQVSEYGSVELSVYDVLGNKIAELVNEKKGAGSYTCIWDAAGHASGTYFVRLSAAGNVQTMKVMLLR